MLFRATDGVLISADARCGQNSFGVVFPELIGLGSPSIGG